MIDCDSLGLDNLEKSCEQYLAKHFEDALLCAKFKTLSAAQLGRLIKHPSLTVPNEEKVLMSVLAWQQAEQHRETYFGLLSQHIHFPCMALKSLANLEQHAQTLGPRGIDLQREVKRARQVHEEDAQDPDCPLVKRRCFQHWWSELGSTISGGIVVADVDLHANDLPLGTPVSIAIWKDSLFVGHSNKSCVSQWKLGGCGRPLIVAGQGAPINGVNEFGKRIRICVDNVGQLLVADSENGRILRFDNNHAEILGDGRVQFDYPLSVFALADDVYVLDGIPAGSRIQKIQSGVTTLVAGGNGHGPALNQFASVDFFVTDFGVVFISDCGNDRILRWEVGALEGKVVAGGRGKGDSKEQLHGPFGIHVTREEDMIIADICNHRIVKWRAGSQEGLVVAGGRGAGNALHQLHGPADVALDSDGAMYIAEADSNRVVRWGPAPCVSFM